MTFIRDINKHNMTAGFVSALLAILSLPMLIMEAAFNGGYTSTQTIYWMTAIYMMGGLLGIVLPLRYRIPIVGANSLTGVAFLATVTPQLTYHELIGASILTGALMLVLGFSGIFKKLIDYVPKEILSAMLAGMIVSYMVRFVLSFQVMAVVGGGTLVAFLLCQRTKRIPPLVAATVTSFILLLLTQPLHIGQIAGTGFVLPQLQLPEFSLISVLSVSIPLALLILSNDVAVGVGALEQNGYRVPLNRVVSLGGICSMLTCFLGGTNANAAGMMTAICADEDAGPREQRYMGAVLCGVLLVLFGAVIWMLVPFIQSLPGDFVSILVGFSFLGVFANSLHTGFSNSSIKLSAAFTFIIAAANFSLFSISAPVWALAAGTVIARYFEMRRFPVGRKKSG